HELDFHASLDSTRYATYKTENSNDYHLSTEGRYDFSSDTNVYGGVHFSQEHEDRESPSARNGLTPTLYHQLRLYGGAFRQFGRVSVRVAGTAQKLDYNNVDFLTSSGAIKLINNGDRNRWQYTGGVRVGYEITPRIEPYVQIALDNRRYDSAADDLGYQRNSSGMRYLAGVRWNIPRTLKLDAFAGWMQQDYKDPRFGTVSAPVIGTALQWSATDRTTLTAYLDRTIEETTVTSTPSPSVVLVSSSYINTYASLGVEHRLTDKLTLRSTGSLSHVAYQGLPRNDDYYGLTLGFVYRLHRNLYFDLSVTGRRLYSSVPGENFNQYTVMARVAIPFSH
ncbi:MAG: outer membrane beta-barrel protein, partial [Bordetella sp.]|uniref:outer membrane beta-barrel protein n=1 Tax=Bordetella sp. TaxID=28081 RepID=UPI003F7CBDF6